MTLPSRTLSGRIPVLCASGSLMLIAACANLVTKEFILYGGPRLPEQQVATLTCALNVSLRIDDNPDLNPETATIQGREIQKWAARYVLLPGRHTARISPYPSFMLGGKYTGLPTTLPHCLLSFEAEAGKRYGIITKDTAVAKAFAYKEGDTTTYIINDIAYSFYVVEVDSKKIVSTGTGSLSGR